MTRDMKYFAVSEFKFDDRNLKALINSQSNRDKKLFAFDLSSLKWEKYFLKSLYGVRKYVFKDPDDTTEGQKRYKK